METNGCRLNSHPYIIETDLTIQNPNWHSELRHAPLIPEKMGTPIIAAQPLLCNNSFLLIKPYASSFRFQFCRPQQPMLSHSFYTKTALQPLPRRRNYSPICPAARRKPTLVDSAGFADEGNSDVRRVLQILLWAAEGVYVLWLFLLPYAPVCFNRYCI